MRKLSAEDIKKLKERDELIFNGLENKKVFPYPSALFDALRPYDVGGFPASIMLFVNEMCNGKCYDRAMLMQLAFDNCQVVHADIESLRITAGEELAEHAFVETTDFGGGKTWVVDTSIGLIYEKEYFYEIEKPKVNRVFTKKQCMANPEVKDIIVSNFEEDKYALPMWLPSVEAAIKKSMQVIEELEMFKKAIGYDVIRAEIDADLELMRTNPAKLDEKFGIVRDKYGNEVSRNGVPNPYYVSREEWDEEAAFLKCIEGNEKELQKYYAQKLKECAERAKKEDLKTDILAKKRLKEILKNPTANFYESHKSGLKSEKTATRNSSAEKDRDRG